jgi:NTP pyrophosphatase (non-canonical NTP hydrolase)
MADALTYPAVWLFPAPSPIFHLMKPETLQHLAEHLRQFAAERDWEQFHSPKNLAMALSVEVAEIVEHFQWTTEEQSRELDASKRRAVEHELADALIYLVRLADQLGIDLLEAAEHKLALNEAKYPAERVRGSSKKYSEYD